ncbi:MAG: hypothetical protein K6F80_02150 [Oscillospiraceae bacterium]|nr:hypothetical protein [Oscillospiraceae bacterium]
MNFVNKRNLGIDILCCVGVLMLLALQYMEAAGFRTMPFTSWSTALPVMIRWFCLSGAALLSAGTGYILCAKKWSTGYFKILIRLVYIYLVCSALGLVMRVFLFNDFIDGTDILRTIFSFSATETSRFAGMYFALLIAAPYLNACFHGLKSRRAQFSLLAMLLLAAGLQPMLYVSGDYLLPEWCKYLFPIACYIGGAYIRKNMKEHSFGLMFSAMLLLLLLETITVTGQSVPVGTLNCTWLDSMASLPSLGIGLLMLLLFHSKKNGMGSAHLFFAGAAAGALCSLQLGDLMIDAALPAVVERTPTTEGQLAYGFFIVPVVFVLGCVFGLVLQSPLFLINTYLYGTEGEEEYDDDDEDSRPRRRKRPEVVVPRRTHTQPSRTEHNSSRHTISVPVSEPELKVRLTQPSMDVPAGIHETDMPEPEPEPKPAYRGKYFAEPEEPEGVRVYQPPNRSLPQPQDRDMKVYVPKHAAPSRNERRKP